MDTERAREIASTQGYEGYIFATEQDDSVGRIDHIKMTVKDDSTGDSILMYFEVSEVNGLESSHEWDRECQEWLERSQADRKPKRRRKAR